MVRDSAEQSRTRSLSSMWPQSGQVFRKMKMTTITVWIPCNPVAQPRQRHRVVTSKSGKAFATNYTPRSDPVQAFKAQVRLAVRQIWQGEPWTGPISLVAILVFPRPKRLGKGGRVWHTSRPDCDNCIKAIKDAIKG